MAVARGRSAEPLVIAAGGAPIMSSSYDYTLESHLNAMLKGEDRLPIIPEQSLRLYTGRF